MPHFPTANGKTVSINQATIDTIEACIRANPAHTVKEYEAATKISKSTIKNFLRWVPQGNAVVTEGLIAEGKRTRFVAAWTQIPGAKLATPAVKPLHSVMMTSIKRPTGIAKSRLDDLASLEDQLRNSLGRARSPRVRDAAFSNIMTIVVDITSQEAKAKRDAAQVPSLTKKIDTLSADNVKLREKLGNTIKEAQQLLALPAA